MANKLSTTKNLFLLVHIQVKSFETYVLKLLLQLQQNVLTCLDIFRNYNFPNAQEKCFKNSLTIYKKYEKGVF